MTPLYASAAMRAIMSDRARLQRMLDFEAALARAEAAVGVITATGAAAIGDACDAARYDIAALVEAQAPSGNIADRRGRCADASGRRARPGGGEFRALGRHQPGCHRHRAGARAARRDRRAGRRSRRGDQGLHRARRPPPPHARGRAHVDAARAADAVRAQARRLCRGARRARANACSRLRREALVLQFGGAAGTLAALGEHGFGVSERLAALLDLPLPDAPWHTHRDRLAEVAACFGILAGTCGKIARDVTLMMQTEVGEAFEPAAPGRGGSSTLPHKRNPVGAAAALSAATVAPNLVATLLAAQVQEHERAPGGWHTEWMTFPALALVTSGALQRRRRDRRRPGDRRRAPAHQSRDRPAARSWPRRCRSRSPKKSAARRRMPWCGS